MEQYPNNKNEGSNGALRNGKTNQIYLIKAKIFCSRAQLLQLFQGTLYGKGLCRLGLCAGGEIA